jgi:hypothetical protein
MGSGGGLGLVDLLIGSGESDLEAFDFAEPSFTFGFGDAVEEVVAVDGGLVHRSPMTQFVPLGLNPGAKPLD